MERRLSAHDGQCPRAFLPVRVNAIEAPLIHQARLLMIPDQVETVGDVNPPAEVRLGREVRPGKRVQLSRGGAEAEHLLDVIFRQDVLGKTIGLSGASRRPLPSLLNKHVQPRDHFGAQDLEKVRARLLPTGPDFEEERQVTIDGLQSRRAEMLTLPQTALARKRRRQMIAGVPEGHGLWRVNGEGEADLETVRGGGSKLDERGDHVLELRRRDVGGLVRDEYGEDWVEKVREGARSRRRGRKTAEDDKGGDQSAPLDRGEGKE